MRRSLTSVFLLGCLSISSLASAAGFAAASGQEGLQPKPAPSLGFWTPLNNQPTFTVTGYPGDTDYSTPVEEDGGVVNQLLLTDGSVMVLNQSLDYASGEVWKLTPDIYGSYINGTWSQLASLPNNFVPSAGASAVLADGRVIIQGGEYSGTNYHFALTNIGYIYDPVSDTWTILPYPYFFQDVYPPRRLFAPRDIGDASCIILADGTYMVQSKMSGQAALLDLDTLTWTETGTSTKTGWNDEEGLTLLPNGKVLTVNCYAASGFMPNLYPYPDDLTGSQLYDPKTGNWTSAGSTIISLTDKIYAEMGPAILRPDGIVAAFGGNTLSSYNLSLYDYKKNEWSVGPAFPDVAPGPLSCADLGGALLPNGNVLVAAWVDFAPPLYFFELTYDTNELIQQPSIPNSGGAFLGTQFLVLPTGQIMSTDETLDVEIYTPGDTSYKKHWAPHVSHHPDKVSAGNTYKIVGKRFNGLSQGASFGDELQSATNYPLVRITNNSTGHVFYCRTHDHSSMAVASDKTVHTYFDVPVGIELGKSKLEVVANGIPSHPVSVVVQ